MKKKRKRERKTVGCEKEREGTIPELCPTWLGLA